MARFSPQREEIIPLVISIHPSKAALGLILGLILAEGLTEGLTLALGLILADALGDTLGDTEAEGLTLAEALGLTLGLIDAEGLTLALTLGLSDGLTEGLIDGLILALGETEAEGLTEGETLADGLTDADGDTEGDTLGLTEGLIEADGLTPPLCHKAISSRSNILKGFLYKSEISLGERARLYKHAYSITAFDGLVDGAFASAPIRVSLVLTSNAKSVVPVTLHTPFTYSFRLVADSNTTTI